MASIKVKFRPSTVDGHKGSIFYQIIHERKTRQFHTDYSILPTEWDHKRSAIITGSDKERSAYLTSAKSAIRHDMERFAGIISDFERGGTPYTTDEVVSEFRRLSSLNILSFFVENLISRLKKNDKTRTAETYRGALNCISKFIESYAPNDNIYSDSRIKLDQIDSAFMEDFEAWQKKRGLTLNSISFYNRVLRAVYNRAVEEGITVNRHPFRHVYTGIDKTVKRALPLKSLKRIKALNLSGKPALEYARDIFIFSFMLRGMSFIDMAYLRKSDLSNGYITYRRRKTGKLLSIKWTKEMQTLLDKYPRNPTCYLLPIIRKYASNERSAYRNASYNINRRLKIIARLAGIDIPLTLYVARHSWASAAKAKGIPLSVISEGMGHENESTTQIYLASLDTSPVDIANSVLLAAIQ